MLQVEFNQMYDRLATFALRLARGKFEDACLATDAVEWAMDKVIDKWVETESYNEIEAKQIIRNSIRNSRATCNLEPISLEGEEFEGMHGYQIKVN